MQSFIVFAAMLGAATLAGIFLLSAGMEWKAHALAAGVGRNDTYSMLGIGVLFMLFALVCAWTLG